MRRPNVIVDKQNDSDDDDDGFIAKEEDVPMAPEPEIKSRDENEDDDEDHGSRFISLEYSNLCFLWVCDLGARAKFRSTLQFSVKASHLEDLSPLSHIGHLSPIGLCFTHLSQNLVKERDYVALEIPGQHAQNLQTLEPLNFFWFSGGLVKKILETKKRIRNEQYNTEQEDRNCELYKNYSISMIWDFIF